MIMASLPSTQPNVPQCIQSAPLSSLSANPDSDTPGSSSAFSCSSHLPSPNFSTRLTAWSSRITGPWISTNTLCLFLETSKYFILNSLLTFACQDSDFCCSLQFQDKHLSINSILSLIFTMKRMCHEHSGNLKALGHKQFKLAVRAALNQE